MDVAISEPDVSHIQVAGAEVARRHAQPVGAWIEDLRYYWFREAGLDGIPLVVSRRLVSRRVTDLGEPRYT